MTSRCFISYDAFYETSLSFPKKLKFISYVIYKNSTIFLLLPLGPRSYSPTKAKKCTTYRAPFAVNHIKWSMQCSAAHHMQ